MSKTSTAAEDVRPDDFAYETIKVECKVTRTLVASIAMGGIWDAQPGMYSRDRTSTKNILNTTRKFTSDFPVTLESSLSAGESFPIEIVDVEGEVSQSTAVAFAEGFEESTRIENSYETDTDATFKESVEKTIEGLDDCEKIIYEEKSFYDDLEVTSNLLTTFKEGWENMEREETFTVEVDIGVGYKWFHVETPCGYRLAIPENDVDKFKGKSLIVWDKTEEDGQLWRWDGKRLSSKLGGVMAITQDGANRGANVVTWTKKPEMGQQWEVNGKHIQSEKEGLYLAVRHGKKGSKVCVWTKTDEEDQHWSILAEGSAEGDFEAKMFDLGKKLKWIKKPINLPTIPRVSLPVIKLPAIVDNVIDVVGDAVGDVVGDAVDVVRRYTKEIKSVVSHPELQMRNKKYTTPVYHGVHGKVNEIPGRITRVTASVDWKDQGWGNLSAAIMLVKVNEKGSKSRCTIFKIKTHQREQLTFDTNTHGLDFFKDMKKGDGFQLWYNVGGTGHKLDVYDLKVTVTYSSVEPSVDQPEGSHIWGVNSRDDIWYRNGVAGKWIKIAGKLKQVSVSADGNHIWGVNSRDDIWYRNGVAGKWIKIGGKLKHVCIGKDFEFEVRAIEPIITKVIAGTNLWTEIDRILYGTVSRDSQLFKSFEGGIFKVLSKVSSFEETDLRRIAEALMPSPNEDGSISIVIDTKGNKSFHLNLSPAEKQCTIFLTQDGENKFSLPTIKEMFGILTSYMGDNSVAEVLLPESVADSISDIGFGLTIEELTFCFGMDSDPVLNFKISMDFDDKSILAKNIGLNGISSDVCVTASESDGMLLTSDLVFKLRNIEIGATSPASPEDPWTFVLLPSESGMVTLDTLLQTCHLGDLSDTGIYSLTNGPSPNVTDLNLLIDSATGEITYFSFAVESTFSGGVGVLTYSNPSASLEIVSPFDKESRSITLELGFEIYIGSIGPVNCSGVLMYSGGRDGRLSGVINAQIVGTVELEDVFDLSEVGDLELNIEELNLELDIGSVSVTDPSFVFNYNEDPSFLLEWDGMRIEVGGEKKLDLYLSIPVGNLTANLISYVHVGYIKDDPDTSGMSTKTFSTDIQVHNNLIGDGLALLGGVGDYIIDQKQLTMTIEKSGRKTLFLLPDGLVPDQITIGGTENGLVLSDVRGFVKPGKKLEFGAGGKLELNMLGLTTVLEGEITVQKTGIVGRMGCIGEITIGRHVKLTSFFIEFGIGRAGGETTFTLYDKPGNLKLIMAMTPSAPPVPYPTSFDLTYPGELSITGLVEAFIGEVPIPKEIGEIVVISGTPDEMTLMKGDLKIEFDILAMYFKVDCFVSVFNGFFEGSVVGEFSIEDGLDFHAKLKPIDLTILKIDGYLAGEQPEMKLVIPGISSNPLDLEVYVSAAVTVLGITRAIRIEVDKEGISFMIRGDMWNVLSAELRIYGDVSDGGASLGVDARFENRIIETITENSHQFVNGLVEGALNGLNSAKEALAKKKEELKKIDYEKAVMIQRVKREREAAKKRIDAAQAKVDQARGKVAGLENEINRQRAIVQRERDAAVKNIEAAKKRLNDAKRALSSIDRQIEARKQEVRRKRQKLVDEIKRLERSIRSAQATVNSWKSSADWHWREIKKYESSIRDKRRAISRLRWYSSWKAPGYLSQIVYYGARIGTLEVARGTILVSKETATAVLKGVQSALSWSRGALNKIPTELLDPVILGLIAKKKISQVALDVAIKFLSGASKVVEWVPIDVDPRVAGVILLKGGANIALTIAYEGLNLLKGAIDLFPVEADPRVLALGAKKVLANTAITIAQGILDTAAAAVKGPMASALTFIADGVNGILKSIPLVINSIDFSSYLSTASGGAIELNMTYTFLGNEHSLQFMFDFSRATDVLIQFAKEIGSKIMGLITGFTSKSLMIESDDDEHEFSLDELNAVGTELKQLEHDLKVEGEQNDLDFEYSKVEMKTALVEAQESMLGLRLAIVDEQKHNGEEFKDNLNRMNAVLDNDTGFEVKMLSSEIKEASGEIFQILGQLDEESDKERVSVEAFGAKLRATRDELQKELEEENQYRTASIDLNLDEETQKEEENSLKRQRVALWNKHERTLRGVVKDDRAGKKDRITARATLLEASARNLETVQVFSNQLIDDINSLSTEAGTIATQNKGTKSGSGDSGTTFSAKGQSTNLEEEDIVASAAAEEDEEEKRILEERDEMIVNLAVYQHAWEAGAESVMKNTNYDMALLQVFQMEDQLMSVLDSLDGEGKMEYTASP